MDKESRWIRFLGGRNLVFTLLVLGMLGAVIFYIAKLILFLNH
nr:hypothetical protein [Liquorilactobacillus satsumensis]